MTTKPADEPKNYIDDMKKENFNDALYNQSKSLREYIYMRQTQLSKHFGKFTCKTLKSELGITTVEEALEYSDETLMNFRGIGKMFCYHLRLLGEKIETKKPVG
jgi:hypothetical protein